MSDKRIISTDKAPQAIGPYSQAIITDKGFIFVSGQIPITLGTGKIAGVDIKSQTRQVFENLKAILEASGVTFRDVVKTTVYLTDIANFSAVNDIYQEYFKDGCFPARSTVQVSKLPKNVLIEIDAIAAL